MSAHALERLRAALADRYAVERVLGRGGMATVYLARDRKHKRDVAIKVLESELTAALGAERFLREVDVLAQLQHPHILPLFDSGQADGSLYYVMPRVEGESLRDRLQRERQLPVDEALQITREVAAALDYAHRRRVIHRDIKPANILLQDGQALVADFGIALGMSAAGEERITSTGLSLGTPCYMSPEQAGGDRDLDARSDLYSLAATLYEMLTGEPPHNGRDMQVVLAKVLTEPIRPVRSIRPTVPANVDAALQKALARLPADRFSSTAAFARALSEPAIASATERSTGPSRLRRWPGGPVATGWSAGALGIVLGGWALYWGSSASVSDGTVRRWSIVLADSAPLSFVGNASLGVGRTSLAIAPDGARLVYVAQRDATTQLYLQEFAKLEATPLPGTAGAFHPFFSPDGRWIGFFAGQELRKVPLSGGQPLTIGTVNAPFGAAWGEDGRILVIDRQGNRLAWVPDQGGTPEVIERQIVTRSFSPTVLAGGDWILHGSIDGVLYLHSVATGWPYAITRTGVVRRDSADLDALLYGANPRYLKSGHIAYFASDGTLMALPFDVSGRRVLGPPAAVLEGVRLEAEAGDAQLSVSDAGTLVYAPGASARVGQFVWVDHATGRLDTLSLPRAPYGGFDLSPDGRQIVVRVRPTLSRGEIWTLDIATGVRLRLPSEGMLSLSPKWGGDGSSVTYYELPPDGRRAPVTLRHSPRNPNARDTLPFGTLASAPGGRDLIHFDGSTLWLVPRGDTTRRVRLGPSRGGYPPGFTPDARWFVTQDADGQGGEPAVFVSRTGHPGERHKISTAGGEEPVWAPDGRTIIYRDRQEWFAVDVSTEGTFRAGRPRLLFRGPFLQVPGSSHDIAPSGKRSLVLLGPPEQTTNRLVVVTNWFAEVARLAGPTRK
jgi:serine/threonine-protein kinase